MWKETNQLRHVNEDVIISDVELDHGCQTPAALQSLDPILLQLTYHVVFK